VAAARTFALMTESVEITHVAAKEASISEDPFHSGSFRKLIKASDAADAKEISIGGDFSVTGSAYVIGCDRIMTQFGLVYFDAPRATPIEVHPHATGGAPIIAPVVYGDTPAHPWQSGCGTNLTDNTVRNGNLVVYWGKLWCKPAFGTKYSVDKVKQVPFWTTGTLNGRYVILLEVQDRATSGLTPTGIYVDQAAVWIDNQIPTALITSIGGLAACHDLYLSAFEGTTCPVRGIAWDPPIDPDAPQIEPNDNFGEYEMTFKKNGGHGGEIPEATPNLRVPNEWPERTSADGILANWDIVNALDRDSPTPTPGIVELAKLERGERCAYVLTLRVHDATRVGDSNNHHRATALYAINIINDL
jgi:hypothetical protein